MDKEPERGETYLSRRKGTMTGLKGHLRMQEKDKNGRH